MPFRISVANPLVMPEPRCWIVYIEGVGEVWECPKKGRVLLCFQLLSAVCRIPIGLGSCTAL